MMPALPFVRSKRMLVGEDCVKEMFADDNFQFWFAKIKVPEEINEVFASLYLSIAGAAINCGAKSAPAEKYYEFLADEERE